MGRLKMNCLAEQQWLRPDLTIHFAEWWVVFVFLGGGGGIHLTQLLPYQICSGSEACILLLWWFFLFFFWGVVVRHNIFSKELYTNPTEDMLEYKPISTGEAKWFHYYWQVACNIGCDMSVLYVH